MTPDDDWLRRLRIALNAQDVDLEQDGDRAIVYVAGLPTDLHVQNQRIVLRYILRTVYRRAAVQPVIRSGELGFDCLIDPENGTLEPIFPAAVRNVDAHETVALLERLNQHAFREEITASRSLISRDATDGRVLQEVRLRQATLDCNDSEQAACIILELLQVMPETQLDPGK